MWFTEMSSRTTRTNDYGEATPYKRQLNLDAVYKRHADWRRPAWTQPNGLCNVIHGGGWEAGDDCGNYLFRTFLSCSPYTRLAAPCMDRAEQI